MTELASSYLSFKNLRLIVEDSTIGGGGGGKGASGGWSVELEVRVVVGDTVSNVLITDKLSVFLLYSTENSLIF